MRAGPASGFVLLALATAGLGGCLGSAVGVLTTPASVAARTAGGVGTRVLNAGGGPVSDLDRILAAHPEAANSGELHALRDSLLDQGMTEHGQAAPPAAPRDEFDRHARHRRAPRDQIRLERPAATGTRQTPPQREEPTPFANARTSSIPPDVRRWYNIPFTPVRITPMDDGRRARRDPDRGGR